MKLLISTLLTAVLIFSFQSDAFAQSIKYKTPEKKTVSKKSQVAKKSTAKKVVTKRAKATKRTSRPANVSKRTSKSEGMSSGVDTEAAISVRNGRARIDFEDLIIQGQLKKADTVYLFQRGESQLRSLVKKKENFREELYENYLN